MQLVRALTALTIAIVIEPLVECALPLVVAASGVDVLAALSLLAKGLM